MCWLLELLALELYYPWDFAVVEMRIYLSPEN